MQLIIFFMKETVNIKALDMDYQGPFLMVKYTEYYIGINLLLLYMPHLPSEFIVSQQKERLRVF